MTVWFVSRHPGAQTWVETQGVGVDRRVEHLDTDEVRFGDTVIGTLPVHLAAEVCARGATYVHLVMDVPPEYRGRELTPAEMERWGSRLETYEVRRGQRGSASPMGRLNC